MPALTAFAPDYPIEYDLAFIDGYTTIIRRILNPSVKRPCWEPFVRMIDFGHNDAAHRIVDLLNNINPLEGGRND